MSGSNTLGMGLVRTCVEARRTIEMKIGLENFGSADIRLVPESFDSSTGTLYFGDCKCSVQSKEGMKQTFNTRASVAGGTYTVLGALGSKPIFVVLRISSAGQ